MPLVFNGTNIDKVIYNGVELDKVIYNDTVAFEKELAFVKNGQCLYGLPTWIFTYQPSQLVIKQQADSLYLKTHQVDGLYANRCNAGWVDIEVDLSKYKELYVKCKLVNTSYHNKTIRTYFGIVHSDNKDNLTTTLYDTDTVAKGATKTFEKTIAINFTDKGIFTIKPYSGASGDCVNNTYIEELILR